MSISACRIVCTVWPPRSVSHTRGATSLDSSWNICKHTCRDHSSLVSNKPHNKMWRLQRYTALCAPWQRCNTAVHLWGILVAIQQEIIWTLQSERTGMNLATPHDQQRCLPATCRLKKGKTDKNKIRSKHLHMKVGTYCNQRSFFASTNLSADHQKTRSEKKARSELFTFVQVYDKHKWSERTVPGQFALWTAGSDEFL